MLCPNIGKNPLSKFDFFILVDFVKMLFISTDFMVRGQKSGQEEEEMARHGENIRRRKDGRWEGRYLIYEPESGRKVTRSVYARTYAAVKEKLLSARISAEFLCEKSEQHKDTAFHIVAAEWLASIEKTRKYATYIKYRSIYEKYIKEKLNDRPLSRINSAILAEEFFIQDEKALSESLRRSIICVLNQMLSYAELYYQMSPCRISCRRQSNVNKPVRVLNQTEQAKLLRCLYDEMDIYKMGILICISTGLRLGEICSLKWEDIDLIRKVLHVNTTVQRIAADNEMRRTILLEGNPKSIFSRREIPLSEDIVKLLTPYYTDSDKYVINRNHPMEPRTYQNKFQNYLKKAGVEKKNFHALRHTFATNCINSGADIKSLSEILGHSDVKITLNRYVHPTLDTKRRHMNTLSSVYGQIMGQ